MKICYKCSENKPLIEFSGDKNRKDGCVSTCKSCIRKNYILLRIKNGYTPRPKRNKDEIVSHNKKYHKEYSKKYNKKRRENDPIFKLKGNTRTLLYNSFKRACNGTYKKSLPTESMLGCSMDFFIKYIESKFIKGMTYDNYGKWHLDHINPIYNCKNIEDIIKYNHYTNFQPLWALDNLKKSKN